MMLQRKKSFNFMRYKVNHRGSYDFQSRSNDVFFRDTEMSIKQNGKFYNERVKHITG